VLFRLGMIPTVMAHRSSPLSLPGGLIDTKGGYALALFATHARALLAGERWEGAVYVGGYVVECLLKWRILKRIGQRELPRAFWHHDLARLVDAAWLRPTLQVEPKAQEWMALITDTWDVTMRYGRPRPRVDRHAATKLLVAVKGLKRWLRALS